MQILNEIILTRDANDWLADLKKAGLPCGPINTIADVFDHPQAEARNLVIKTEHSTAGTLKLTGFPYKLTQTPADVHHPPPTLGEHTNEVLVELLGYSSDDVSNLQEQGTI